MTRGKAVENWSGIRGPKTDSSLGLFGKNVHNGGNVQNVPVSLEVGSLTMFPGLPPFGSPSLIVDYLGKTEAV